MGHDHMGPLPTPRTEWQTDTTENITFPQLPWRMVNITVVMNTRRFWYLLIVSVIRSNVRSQHSAVVTSMVDGSCVPDYDFVIWYWKFPSADCCQENTVSFCNKTFCANGHCIYWYNRFKSGLFWENCCIAAFPSCVLRLAWPRPFNI